jgi:hypothetical protein
MSTLRYIQIIDLLVECRRVLSEPHDTETMMLYLHRLYEVTQQIEKVRREADDRDVRRGYALIKKPAQRFRRRFEERLRVRN